MSAADVNQLIDSFVRQIRANYHSLLLASVSQTLGNQALESYADGSTVSIPVATDTSPEPLPIGELKQYRSVFPSFVCEAFHGRFVQLWQDLLNALFEIYLNLHFGGLRPFAELKSRPVKLDFSCSEQIEMQASRALSKEFAFADSGRRVKLLNSIRNPGDEQASAFEVVRVNVGLRNCCQHSHGVLTQDVLRQLGLHRLTVLNSDGDQVSLSEGERIVPSVPQVNEFRRALLLCGQA